MAVPKKKTSKGKRNQRHAIWKGKAAIAAEKALSIGKSVLTGRAQGFVYPMNEAEEVRPEIRRGGGIEVREERDGERCPLRRTSSSKVDEDLPVPS